MNQGALLEACETRGEALDLLALADWYTEHAGVSVPAWHARTAYALRWMAARGHRPYHRLRYHHSNGPGRAVPEKYGWAWYAPWSRTWDCAVKNIPGYAILPRLAFLAIGPLAKQHLSPTWLAAVRLLAAGLADLRQAATINPEDVT